MSDFWDTTLPLLYKKGLSQADLARIVDRPRSTISNWLKRDTEPSASESVKIAMELGTTVENLTGIHGVSDEGISELRREFHQWIDNLDEEELKDLDTYFNLLESGCIVTSLRNKKTGE